MGPFILLEIHPYSLDHQGRRGLLSRRTRSTEVPHPCQDAFRRRSTTKPAYSVGRVQLAGPSPEEGLVTSESTRDEQEHRPAALFSPGRGLPFQAGRSAGLPVSVDATDRSPALWAGAVSLFSAGPEVQGGYQKNLSTLLAGEGRTVAFPVLDKANLFGYQYFFRHVLVVSVRKGIAPVVP